MHFSIIYAFRRLTGALRALHNVVNSINLSITFCDPKTISFFCFFSITLLQFSLGLVQRVVVAGGVVDAGVGGHVVEALWLLMEAGVEELRVLQTTTLLVTVNDAIHGENLAKVRKRGV